MTRPPAPSSRRGDARPARSGGAAQSAGAPDVSARMQERLAERRSADAVRRSRRSGRVWLALAVGGASLWAAFGSPLFALSEDRVAVTLEARVEGDGGAGVVSAPDVRAALAAFAGTRLTTLNVGQVEAAVQGVAGVRGVAVEREWPRGLRVTVWEKVAVAAVPVAGGGYMLLDAGGGQLLTADLPPTDLPVVVVPVGEGNAATLAAVLGVAAQLPPELADRVEGIRAKSADSVEFDLRDGVTVSWGNSGDTPLKAQVLLVLLGSSATANAIRIDVSAPGLPIVVDAPAE